MDDKKWEVCDDCKVQVLSLLVMEKPYPLPCFAKKMEGDQSCVLFENSEAISKAFDQNSDPSKYVFGLILFGDNRLWIDVLEKGDRFRQSDKELSEIEEFILKKPKDDHWSCPKNPCGMVRVGWKGISESAALCLCPSSISNPGDLKNRIRAYSEENKLDNVSFMVSCDSSLQSFPTMKDLKFFCDPEDSEEIRCYQTIQELKKAYSSPFTAPWLLKELLPTKEFTDIVIEKQRQKLSKIETVKRKLQALEILQDNLSLPKEEDSA